MEWERWNLGSTVGRGIIKIILVEALQSVFKKTIDNDIHVFPQETSVCSLLVWQ